MVNAAFLLAVITAAITSGTDLEEIRSRSFGLADPNGNAYLTPIVWTEVDTLEVEFGLTTYSYEGRILLLQTTGVGALSGLILRDLIINVDSRGLNFSILDGDKKMLSTARPFDIDVSDNKLHKVNFLIDLPRRQLTIKLDKKTATVDLTNVPSKLAEVNASFYVGGNLGPKGDEKGIVGCIQDFSVKRGNAAILPDVETINGDVSHYCPDICLKTPESCGATGLCLNRYSTSSCDCYQSHREGSKCEFESSVVTLDSGKYLSFATISTEDKQPERLALSFKTSKEANQLLLYAPVHSSGDVYRGQFSVIADTQSVTVTVTLSDKLTITLASPTELNDNRWHQVKIEIAYNQRLIKAQLDEEKQENKTWKLTDTTELFEAEMLLFDSKIFFANTPPETEIASSFEGCMKDLYVGYEQILPLVKQSNSKVTSSEDLKFECSVPTAAILPEAATPVGDAETTEAPPTAEKPEDPNELQPESTPAHAESHVRHGMFMASPNRGVMSILEKCDQITCAHQTKCVANLQSGDVSCNCTGTHYTGRFCQFSTLPRSCDEVYHSGNQFAPGVYSIDPDGSGDLSPTYVRCSKKENLDVGITEVEHNFPDDTVIRKDSNTDDLQYNIAYRLFDADSIKALQLSSTSCQQSLRYVCNNAPLELSKATWFRSISFPGDFGDFGGSAPNTCSCRDKGCSEPDLSCNCDSSDGRETLDEGILRGQFAGISRVTVKQHKNQDYGRLTIGPLQCEGTPGLLDSIVFRSKTATLKGPKWNGARLGLWFRTSALDGVILSQGAADRPLFKATLEEGHAIHYQFAQEPSAAGPYAEARVVSQHPLNDSNWHHLTVEFSQGEFRLTVDHFESFLKMEYTTDDNTDRRIIIGGIPGNDDGFVGCVRGLYLDTSHYSTKTLLIISNQTEGIRVGCQDHCEEKPCSNEAKCAEDYEADSYICICANPHAHSGKDCNEDINVGGEVTFNSVKRPGFISYSQLSNSPLSSDILISFRTDQTGALILFAIDQFFNFIQVHLLETNKLVLTINYDKVIKQCTIHKDYGEFSNMQWIQLALKYHNGHTAFYADDQLCEIEGKHELSDTYIAEWVEGAELETIKGSRPAVAPSNSESIYKYTIIYVGGVPTPKNGLSTFFSTNLPHLLGCMRGFKVGDTLISLDESGSRNGVINGCNTGCESIDCQSKSGGHCQVGWLQNTATFCDCSLSSYVGSSCTEDVGVTFTGESAISFDLESALNQPQMKSPSKNREFDAVHFAFSTSTIFDDHKALLLRLTFSSEAVLEVYLEQINKEESLGFRLFLNGKEEVRKFSGNFSDSFRHFVYMRFTVAAHEHKLSIKVDRRRTEIPLDSDFNLEMLKTAQIGGPQDQLVGVSDYVGYSGCLSNLVLSIGQTGLIQYQPIDYYFQKQNPNAKYTRLHSSSSAQNLKLSECSKFALAMPTGGEVVTPPLVSFPPWNQALEWTVVQKPTPESKDPGIITTSDATTSSPFPSKILIIILAILLTVIVVGVFIYVYYVRCIKKPPQQDQEKGAGPKVIPDKTATAQEKQPLNSHLNDPVHPTHQPRLSPLTTHPEEENEENEEREEREFHTPEGSNVSRSSLQSPVFAPNESSTSSHEPFSYPATPVPDETVKTRDTLSSQKSYDPNVDLPYVDDLYQRLSKTEYLKSASTNKPPTLAKPRLPSPPSSPNAI